MRNQLATDAKSNEITAIPELLDTIEVNRAIVTIDAAGCQKSIASQIYLSGGDYVLALKANQGGLHAAVVEYVDAQIEDNFKSAKAQSYTDRVNGHGQKDELVYYQMPIPQHLAGRAGWHGMQTIGVVVRMSERGDTFTSDVRYYISSLRMGVKLVRCLCTRPLGHCEHSSLVSRCDVPRRRLSRPKRHFGRECRLAKMLRDQPPQAGQRQRKCRDEASDRRLEPRLHP